jgi:hypothetical protein
MSKGLTTIFGVDLGKMQDYSTLAILQLVGELNPIYQCGWLHRFALNTRYMNVVKQVTDLINRPVFANCDKHLVLDHTCVGNPVSEMFEGYEPLKLNPLKIDYHGGFEVTKKEEDRYSVPKRDLAMEMNKIMQSRRLKVASALEHAEAFQKEMEAFRLKITAKGNDTYEAERESDHDDLVLAVACAIWAGEHVLHPGLIPKGSRANVIKHKPLGVVR